MCWKMHAWARAWMDWLVVQAKQETVDKVCEIVRKQLALPPEKEITPQTTFSDLGADSLDTVITFYEKILVWCCGIRNIRDRLTKGVLVIWWAGGNSDGAGRGVRHYSARRQPRQHHLHPRSCWSHWTTCCQEILIHYFLFFFLGLWFFHLDFFFVTRFILAFIVVGFFAHFAGNFESSFSIML